MKHRLNTDVGNISVSSVFHLWLTSLLWLRPSAALSHPHLSAALARSEAGFEKPDADLHLLHKFDELQLTGLAGFQILN